MIKSLKIKDFLSFSGQQTIQLNPDINILLGINGSGKTSFINAFRLLYEGVCGDGFENLFQTEWGGYNEVVNANGGRKPTSIELEYVFDCKKLKQIVPKCPFKNDVCYSIIIRPFGDTNYTLEEKLYAPNLKDPNRSFVFLDFKNNVGKLSVYHSSSSANITTETFAGDTSGQELILRQISDPRRYLPMHTIRTAISQMALYESFDTTSHSEIRRPVRSTSELKLHANGDNLISVLNNIKTNDLIYFKSIQNQLKVINKGFEEFVFQNFGSQIYMYLQESNMRKAIGLRFISDGTLHYILMLAILMNKKGGYFIGFDEPESRLHPDMIHSIADLMKKSSKKAQILIATHSPLLLNDFDLEHILVFEKDESNATVVKRYHEEDFEDYIDTILPGQLWLNGELGGKRW